MANRNIQAKDLKRKRRGKQRPRTGKAINIGTVREMMSIPSGPDRDEMRLMKARTGNTIFRDLKGSIHVNKGLSPEMLAFWEARYPSMKYPKAVLKQMGLPDEYGVIRNNPYPRGEALRRADQMLKGWELTLHFRIKQGINRNTDLFFNSSKTKWCLFETDLDRRIIRKSAIYNYREIIENALNNNRVLWVDEFHIPPEDGQQ